jgi:hypothetical protein
MNLKPLILTVVCAAVAGCASQPTSGERMASMSCTCENFRMMQAGAPDMNNGMGMMKMGMMRRGGNPAPIAPTTQPEDHAAHHGD